MRTAASSPPAFHAVKPSANSAAAMSSASSDAGSGPFGGAALPVSATQVARIAAR